MAERTQYTPGTFSWTDLATTDAPAAKQYYQGLFGWEAQDIPVGDGVFYSMMLRDGKPVAAIAPQPERQREAGAPPAWQSYVSVESADAAVERAKELGGTVHAPAFDVMQAGRMGVIQDPQGAYFLVWEPRDHIGASFVNGPGALSWNELATTDIEAAATFYGGLFGWTATPFEGMDEPYQVISNAGRGNGGIHGLPAPGVPPHWTVYFGTEEIDSGLAKARELGGNVVAGPIDIGIAKIGFVTDPQGAGFALYAGQFED